MAAVELDTTVPHLELNASVPESTTQHQRLTAAAVHPKWQPDEGLVDQVL
jgi:hypothetical protein